MNLSFRTKRENLLKPERRIRGRFAAHLCTLNDTAKEEIEHIIQEENFLKDSKSNVYV